MGLKELNNESRWIQTHKENLESAPLWSGEHRRLSVLLPSLPAEDRGEHQQVLRYRHKGVMAAAQRKHAGRCSAAQLSIIMF